MTDRIDPSEAHSVKVAGIPCLALVTFYSPGHPGRPPAKQTRGPMIGLLDNGDPPEPEEIEFLLYDRKGYPADWLARKLTDSDVCEIKEQISDSIQQEEEDRKADAEIAAYESKMAMKGLEPPI